MVGINILHNHEGNCQLEQPSIEKGRHLYIILREQGQDSIYFLHLTIPHTQLVLVAVVG